MLVRVALDLALDRLFTYEVPEALQKKLAVGQLLSVSFGHREARGFVLGIDRVDRRIGVDTGNIDIIDTIDSTGIGAYPPIVPIDT